MKKLIVKSQLVDRAKFDRKLANIGMVLSSAIWQHERVYVAHDYRPRMNYPRLMLRTEVAATDQPARYALRLKRHIEDSGEFDTGGGLYGSDDDDSSTGISEDDGGESTEARADSR